MREKNLYIENELNMKRQENDKLIHELKILKIKMKENENEILKVISI